MKFVLSVNQIFCYKKFEKIHLIHFVAFVKPICLPFSDNDKEEYKFDSEGDLLNVTVAGWGATDPRGKNSYLYFSSTTIM